MDKWHIIYTQTYKEKYLDYQIKNLGLKTYLPLYKRSVSHSRKVIEKTYSLFPRYLFVKFDVNKSTYNHLKKLHKGRFHSSPSFKDAFFFDMIQDIIDTNVIVEPIPINGGWCEIDRQIDLERAKEIFSHQSK